MKLNLSSALNSWYGRHRSGWSYAMHCLKKLHHLQGVYVEPYMEKNFSLLSSDNQIDSPTFIKEWIGFLHMPPNIPIWFNETERPQAVFKSEAWQKSSVHCKGLFCLSRYHADWLRMNVPEVTRGSINVNVLRHPTENPHKKFSMESFLNNESPMLVQLGWWLRKLHSIYFVKTSWLKRAILHTQEQYIINAFESERNVFNLSFNVEDVTWLNPLNDRDYDELLSKNVVYLELYDSSANNAIVECIVRNTPVLVNPLPAVLEYLGPDYPLYYNSREEAAEKSENLFLLEKASSYLQQISDSKILCGSTFLKEVKESYIYKSL